MLDESSSTGSGWFADLGRDWEQSADAARNAGIRVVHPRFGLVLTPAGGALGSLMPIFQVGGGGPVGSGKQWWSWVSMEDVLGAIHHMLTDDSMAGPINVAAPAPVRNSEFVSVLGEVMHRPAFIPAPAFALRAMFGEMADEALLASQRMRPGRLLESGFSFRHTDLSEAMRFVLGR